MIQRDHIMRMIQQLTAALAKALFNRELKQFDDALEVIDTTGERLFGMKWKLLRNFSDEQIIELLGYEETLGKLFAAAELLREESDILLEQGKDEESHGQGLKSFSIYVELISRELSYRKISSVDKFAALLDRLEQYEFSRRMELKRCKYYIIVGKFDMAGEILRGLNALDSSLGNEGAAFVRNLLKKSNEELSDANLVRQRLEEEAKTIERGAL